jgi:para-aminobenzoate synthetase/4-amino-4-deoxychorismate lyase
MGFSPNEGGGTIRNLSDHLDRLKASAAYLGFPEPNGAASSLFEAVTDRTQPLRLRLEFRRDASYIVTTSPHDAENASSVQRLCVDHEAIDPLDLRLFHKTTSREVYEERARRHRNADDVILVNRRGELTETTRANLAVLLDGQWCTPPLTSGLLPGIERARMLREGTVIERVVMLEDLERSSGIATMSSLRGWRRSVIVAPCSCTTMNA